MGIKARDSHGEDIEMPFTLKIQNEAVAYESEYTATTGGEMQFISPLKDKSDAILIYIRPEGFDEKNIASYNYTVTISTLTSIDSVFTEKLSPTSWTSFGFKVFVPSGTLEVGTVLVSLTVVEGK